MKAILVLGADVERCKKRFDAALPLYLQDPKDSIIITSGKDWKDEEVKEYVSSKCKQHDIKIEDEHDSKTTRENAIYSLKKMEESGIVEADIISGSSQAAATKTHFKKNNKHNYELNFYAASEGLKTSLKHFPLEIAKLGAFFMSEYIDEAIREMFEKLFK